MDPPFLESIRLVWIIAFPSASKLTAIFVVVFSVKCKRMVY